MNPRSVAFMTIIFLGYSVVSAHPGVGIVMDSKGDVYYTDLKQVWRIAPDGRSSIAVRNVHTHELYVDRLDNLYGEHLWYEGDATKKWGHRVWRLSPDGKLTDIIPARQGFLDDYDDFHFVHDRSGAMYWPARGDVTAIRKRPAGGPTTTIVTAPFRNVRWMTVTNEGTLYLIDLHDLVQVGPDGTVRTIVKNLADRPATDIHAIMGLWTDAKGAVYAAVFSDREVKRVNPDGRVEVAARTPLGWRPSGGFTDANGDLWILECSVLNAVRVRRIKTDGTVTVFD